jgi:hypothetical protein
VVAPERAWEFESPLPHNSNKGNSQRIAFILFSNKKAILSIVCFLILHLSAKTPRQ